MSVAHAVTVAMKTHARKPSDFYPTPHDGTHAVVPRLKLRHGAKVGEPACGDGAMARVLAHAGFDVVASDLRETGYGLGGQDYLGEDPDDPYDGAFGALARFGALDAIVTNPPFNLAEQFIRKAVRQAPVVAMLLKATYWNSGRGLKFFDECPPTDRADLTWRLAFLEEERGNNPLMDCAWFIWRAGDPPLSPPLARPVDTPYLPPLLSVALAQNAEARAELTEALHGRA